MAFALVRRVYWLGRRENQGKEDGEEEEEEEEQEEEEQEEEEHAMIFRTALLLLTLSVTKFRDEFRQRQAWQPKGPKR
jgi:hypothetical protein